MTGSIRALQSRAAMRCALALLLAAFCPFAASATACKPDALGTARVLAVDPAKTPRVGLKHFPVTLPLADKEVVLTFDDGPNPPTTNRVLQALERECVQATFFLIGRSAAAHPALVREIAARGHTIGHHTYSHPSLLRIAHHAARAEIDNGIAADETALKGAATINPSTPFFRFPGFESTPALLDLLEQRRIAVFGADFWASDWNSMTPEQQYDLLIARLEEARRGIILFHDTKAQTAAMLPKFLRYLHTHGYRVVHIVPAASASSR
jgi:peptidoglycan/xylan/chitin deacetylase (PgdA/CDA1 family)